MQRREEKNANRSACNEVRPLLIRFHFFVLVTVFSFAVKSSYAATAVPILHGSVAIGAEWMNEFNTGSLKIDKIELLQPHLIPVGVVKSIVAPYEGKDLSVKDLQKVQREFSRYYAKMGYSSSGVIIPNQKIANGTIKMRAVHGRVKKIDVDGNNKLENEYFYQQLTPGLGVPVNTLELQRALVLLRQNPLIQSVSAQLLPGETLGENILKLRVVEARTFHLNVNAGNTRSPSIGGNRIGISVMQQNWPGSRHVLSFDAGWATGLYDLSGSYTIPFGFRGANFKAFGAYSDFSVVEKNFEQFNLESQSWVSGATLTIPLIRRIAWDAHFYTGIDVKETRSNAAIQTDTETKLTVANAGINLTKHGAQFVAIVSGGMRYGVDAFDATISEQGPDGRFSSYVFQSYFTGRLIGSSQWVARGVTQYTSDELLAMEQFAVGGMHSVRGYRENVFVRDIGATGSLEFHIPLGSPNWKLALFSDAGRAWDVQPVDATSQKTIASVGAGLIIQPVKSLSAELYWGHALFPAPHVGDDWQDKGLHGRFSYNIF